MSKQKLTVLSEVKKHLKKYGTISPFTLAYTGLNGVKSLRLSARIYDLRQLGWHIDLLMEKKQKNGRLITETTYILRKAGL